LQTAIVSTWVIYIYQQSLTQERALLFQKKRALSKSELYKLLQTYYLQLEKGLPPFAKFAK